MQHTAKQATRRFLSQDFCLKSREDIQPYYENLLQISLDSLGITLDWMARRDEYDGCLSEVYCRADIDHARFLEDKELEKAYFHFIETIQPEWMKMSDLLNRHLMTSIVLGDLETIDGYRIMIRGIRSQITLYREENIALFEQEQKLTSEYSKIRGAMTIAYQGSILTLNQAAKYLESQERAIREEVYNLMIARQQQDTEAINIVLDNLLAVRHQIAINAGFSNYVEYIYPAKGRFDYGQDEVFDFHTGVEKVISPLCQIFLETRQKSLKLDELRPYDLAVDIYGRELLQAFTGEEEAIDRTIACLDAMDQDFGDVLRQMKEYGHFDLDSRTGKRGGAFISRSQYETKIPYMFGNLVGTLNDISTMIHESGHAIHGQMMHDSLPLNAFSDTPSEIAEIGSMALELLSMDHRDVFEIDSERLHEAQHHHLQDGIEVLAWISCIDSFQHWLYTHIGHSHEERAEKWLEIYDRYKTSFVDFSGYENHKVHLRQKQVHIFEYPFYYIEYGIAQLAAFGIYAQYKKDKNTAFMNYKKILSLGYTKTMPEIFEAGGLEFSFGEEKMREVVSSLVNLGEEYKVR